MTAVATTTIIQRARRAASFLEADRFRGIDEADRHEFSRFSRAYDPDAIARLDPPKPTLAK